MSRRGPFQNMLRTATRLSGGWRRLRARSAPAVHLPSAPAELFSAEQMEQHGRRLAASHVLSAVGTRNQLLDRLTDNVQVLIETCSVLTAALKARQRIAPAGEWLLDNFYLIEEQIRTARQHLPKAYSRQLPSLAKGPSRGMPRVYDLAIQTISHGDGRVDAHTLGRLIRAYQSVIPLTLGELWAIPIMLRLALIENLRRVSERLTAARIQIDTALDWANRMMEVAERDPKGLILVIADMARSNPPMASPFVAELARHLQGHGPALALPLTWIAQRLAESNQTIEQMVLTENQQQAADQVSISNSIGGLRSLGALDWRVFVEAMSQVEQSLRHDPSGYYPAMDFATRDRYRHVVAGIALRSAQSETVVAATAVALAQRAAASSDSAAPSAHVGYFLIDRGLTQLEAAVAARRLPLHRALQRRLGHLPLAMHLTAIVGMTALATTALLWIASSGGVTGPALVTLGALAVVACSQLACALVNWLATQLSSPQILPRMDYSNGLPADMRCVVVIPTMITDAHGVDALVEALEVRFLGNRDSYLHFILLTDFRDAATETLPADAPLLRRAQAGIEGLNAKYPSTTNDRFLLLHRPRRWNATDGIWMGHERKRGKLGDLNAALRGDLGERFALIVGDLGALASTRYVITLDTDTQLPRDAAREFIATMAHPLNRPQFDAKCGRVIAGYGILQPRMAASLSGANRSRYAQLFGSEAGIDPYTRSVSDVYQDLYGEGSFIGKGIYDLDAFERALAGRLPDNRILSHDLLEGCYARSGLLSDVHLYEDYPAHYGADVSRRQRWIRGDWQIASWMLPRVPGVQARGVPNPLSDLSRWKILDNLRRSLVPAALLLLLIFGWLLGARPALWTLAVLGIVLLQPLLSALQNLFRWSDEMLLEQHLAALGKSVGQQLAQVGFQLACLPHEALGNLDAIGRSIWRTLVSRRRLLEWRVSSSDSTARTGDRFRAVLGDMWAAPATALATALALALLNPEALPAAALILAAWLAAPVLVWRLNLPLRRRQVELDLAQVEFLRRTARKTWAFFDRFVVAGDNWLPPDNVQEDPGPTVAHRTSPTNIGLSLLANLAAHDFGYLSSGGLLLRTANTFHSLSGLERHAGHFYNWYDTQTLLPLAPRYVSTVDSGNLAGHLLTLRAGLLALPDQPVISAGLAVGLADTLDIVRDALAEDASPADPVILGDLEQRLTAWRTHRPATLGELFDSLQSVAVVAARLHASAALGAGSNGIDWALALHQQCRDVIEDLLLLAPWLADASGTDGRDATAGISASASLHDLERHATALLASLDPRSAGLDDGHRADRDGELRASVKLGLQQVRDRLSQVQRLAQLATGFADMEYGHLYDSGRHLLAIGYNVDDHRRDTAFYDLLASEARLGTFVLIAQGQLPQESWFALGRLLTTAGGEPVLVSWSGSMFEYLMPMLVMPTYEGSLLDQTCRAAVARQIAHGSQTGLPWGISESGYNTVDAALNYQYHAFGVPGLGLKRGLAEDTVVAPYASGLALMVDPEAACRNLQRLAADGLEGQYGFYEAVDYTPARLLRGQTQAIVRSFMAHHQGMFLLSVAHLLLERPMQRRFESDPQFQATLLLLQERIPRSSIFRWQLSEQSEGSAFFDSPTPSVHAPIGAETATPEVQLLSNGRYHVMLTNAGGGYSRWKDLALTRWREDSTRDHWGSFLYLRDVQSNAFWSAAHQPVLAPADAYEAVFSEGRAEYRRRDHDIETHCDVVVSPRDDVELRRIRINNRSRRRRTIEITSYAEVVLAAPAADAVQTAFGNLFVQTEIVSGRRAILCTRRPRSADETTPWMFHLLAINGTEVEATSFETDRLRFIGRGRTLANPLAMAEPGALSGTQGSVLDPIVAIRCRLTLDPDETALLDWVFGVAEQRDAALSLIDKYQDRLFSDRIVDLACTHSGVTLRQINATESDAQLYRRLAGHVLYANSALRASAALLQQNHRGQSGLWGYAISGDLPIVLLKIADAEQIDLARKLIQCHGYWRLKGLAVDLVIWNEDHIGYRQRLQDQIMSLVSTGSEAQTIDRPGGIFVRFAEQIASEDRILLQAVARVIISDGNGSLTEQVSRKALSDKRVAALLPLRGHRPEPAAALELPADLILRNPLGGFSADGNEYLIVSGQAQSTPLPWVNVLANPCFGAVLTESGLGYTFGENAHEFRLTPWSDDQVGASGGEAFYLRDEESGHYWSPAAQPAGGAMPYLTRHGFGYSVFEHTSGGIRSELWVYVDLVDAVKFSVLKVRNGSGRRRRLSATGYVEWVLGDLRTKSAMHVVTELDPASGAVFARNAYSTEFSSRVAFFDADDPNRSLTGDRTEFLGRNGSLQQPDALLRAKLSGKLGAGIDPCAAIQVAFDLADGQEHEIVFRLGVGGDLEQARALALRLRRRGTARTALEQVRSHWQHTLGAVQVATPDPALNVLANGWLLYQTLACRIWARSGYYQSGGAFGFRDQLQDSMALVHTRPALLREQILLCAARQFPQGDVQHWWHPPAGRGVRTRCSDDYLWLPLAVCRYVRSTGDGSVLDAQVHFLEGRALNPDEESYYDLPGRSERTANLYEHCKLAIVHGLRMGERGLPLIGSGDWNDGMNLVGIHGKGESVWLGFFLHAVLQSFAEVAERQSDLPFAERCRLEASRLRDNLAAHAWDGEWFRRAWFDDGTALGSAANQECRIDSIAQSWSVLSGAADAQRARQAMDSLDRHLVRREDGLIQLLDPPFDTSTLNPGYIKGYVPGVRENGGQYTHAAIWAVMAFAQLGDRRRAWELFDLINPVNHGRSSEGLATYKVEPYVVAADVYAIAPHTGRGGWTWYTGSAGWTYRLIVESLLGITRLGDRLQLSPCLPDAWPGFAVDYRFGATTYRIVVTQRVGHDPAGPQTAGTDIHLDGVAQDGSSIQLIDDQQPHRVDVSLRVVAQSS